MESAVAEHGKPRVASAIASVNDGQIQKVRVAGLRASTALAEDVTRVDCRLLPVAGQLVAGLQRARSRSSFSLTSAGIPAGSAVATSWCNSPLLSTIGIRSSAATCRKNSSA